MTAALVRLAVIATIATLMPGGVTGRPVSDRTPLGGRPELSTGPGQEVAEAQEPTTRLTLLFTAETRGNLVPCSCPKNPLGGLARRVGFLRDNDDGGNILRVDAGGFLPEGEVPLRDDPGAAAGLLRILQDGLKRAGYQAVVVDRGDRAFLARETPAQHASLRDLFLDADPPSPARILSWGTWRTALLALDERLPDSTVVRAAAQAREDARLLVVLARADGFSGRRLARLSHADLVVLSRGANPEQTLYEGSVPMVGCGLEGKQVGEVILSTGARGVTVSTFRLHPMDAQVKEESVLAGEVRRLEAEWGPSSSTLLGARE